jgi:erythritol transport system permease protein
VASNSGRTNETLSKGGFLNTQGLATVVVFVLIFIFLSIAAPSFLTVTNLIGLVRQVALLLIVAVGMTFLIIAGGIDLSVGSSCW